MRALKLGVVCLMALIPMTTWGQSLLVGGKETLSAKSSGNPSNSASKTTYVLDPPADIREEALENMRYHMGGLRDILAWIAAGDIAKVGQAARTNGMAYMKEHGTMGMWAMSHGYPWMNYCNPMHGQFDHIADLADQGSDPKTLTKETSVLIQACLSCHEVMKFKY